MFQTLPPTKGRTGEGLGMLPRSVYMSDSMPNRSGSHRGVVARPYADTGQATSASAVSVGHSDIPSHALGSAAGGCGSIQSGTTPRRRGVFTTFGKGFVSTFKGGRGVPSTSAPNLGDIWLFGRPTDTACPDNPACSRLAAACQLMLTSECVLALCI